MATIHNTELFKEIKDGAKLQQLNDVVPSELAKSVVPVMEVNPKFFRRCNIVRRATATNATSATIYTVPSDKDFYLTAASISIIKDATATSTLSSIRVFPEGMGTGTNQDLLAIPGLTLTAQSESNSITLPYPIKVERGTAITVTAATNIANITATGTIIGYTVDNITA